MLRPFTPFPRDALESVKFQKSSHVRNPPQKFSWEDAAWYRRPTYSSQADRSVPSCISPWYRSITLPPPQ